MSMVARLKREARYVRGLARTLGRVRTIAPDSETLTCDDLEAAVDKHAASPAVVFEGRTVTYAQYDGLANRYAHWAKAQNIRRGDVVALFMPNRIEYLAVWYGLMKVGVVTALINHNLTGRALAHCVEIAGANHCIADQDTAAAFDEARSYMVRPVTLWTHGGASGDHRDLDRTLQGASTLRPDRAAFRTGLSARETALYIYTSGTTGLPKAAKITHMRAQLFMRGFAGSTGATAADRIYNVLPLYHSTGGLCAVGAALLNGGTVLLRRKFSASHFWSDVSELQATMFVYIGELGRYLLNSPEHPQERDHKLRLAFGNGLRPDVWAELQSRFRIPDVLEFYGSTEGNVSFFNFDGKTGAIGRIPGYIRKSFNVRLVKFDLDTEQPVRGPDGLCVEAAPDEIGEAVGEIGTDARSGYTGYADKAASERKVLRDVFRRGDAWFRTGDLMRQDAEGYFYFVDRIGDTFRWKGENVSTTEVAERLSSAPGVAEVNIYGVAVPGADGRAGMAAIDAAGAFDIAAFQAHADRELPTYARPLFVRLKPELEATGTFKHRKVDLVQDGFDPDRVADPLWFRDPERGFVPIDQALHARIVGGAFKL